MILCRVSLPCSSPTRYRRKTMSKLNNQEWSGALKVCNRWIAGVLRRQSSSKQSRLHQHRQAVTSSPCSIRTLVNQRRRLIKCQEWEEAPSTLCRTNLRFPSQSSQTNKHQVSQERAASLVQLRTLRSLKSCQSRERLSRIVFSASSSK